VTFDQLRLRLLRVEARVAVLEARRPPKRPAAPRPDDAIIGAREKLWAKYLLLEMARGHGRVKLTKLSFAVRYKLNPTEFTRWFSGTDRKAIAEGTGQDQRFRRALVDAIAELEARSRGGDPLPRSHDVGVIAPQVQ
jgi:hypothetical protein